MRRTCRSVNRVAMSLLAETLAYIFGLIGLGYATAWSGLLRPGAGEGLTDFAIGVAMPVLLFRTMAVADFSDVTPWLLWGCYFAAAAVAWAAGHFVAARLFGREPQAAVIAGLSASYSNLVLFGGPFILSVFGQPGFEVMTLILAIHLPVMMAVSIVLFEWVRRHDAGPPSARRMLRDFARNVVGNPLVLGMLAGFLWRLSGFSLPSAAGRLVDTLATIAAPLALIAMGMGLRRFGISGNVRPAMALAALKLLLMPAAALALALVFALPAPTAMVLVVAAGLPTGINPYLIASRFGTGQAISSNTMTVATLGAMLTAGMWAAVVQAIFG